ncbi:MAG: hypothetical protein WCL50_09280 [Spirochaetota bacterium]
MNTGIVVYLITRLSVAGIMTFLAIVLWSRTRDIAWMLMVIGAVSSYADVLFDILVRLGLLDEARFSVFGIPLARIVFSNLPYLFLSAAFLVMIARKRLH